MNDFDLASLMQIVKELNTEVEKIKLSNLKYSNKEDDSPLTQADLLVNQRLTDFIGTTKVKNIISEEVKIKEYEIRKNWDKYWVMDPIDGTKEFINQSTDYTINIALCAGPKPVFGLVSCPAMGDIYHAFYKKGAFLNNKQINVSAKKTNKIRVVASKSHLNADTENYINQLKQKGDIDLKNYGSSLKICKIAEGLADIYPRFGPTMEWDTCAAEIILNEAGGHILSTENQRIKYNKPDLKNPYFIASAKKSLQ